MDTSIIEITTPPPTPERKQKEQTGSLPLSPSSSFNDSYLSCMDTLYSVSNPFNLSNFVLKILRNEVQFAKACQRFSSEWKHYQGTQDFSSILNDLSPVVAIRTVQSFVRRRHAGAHPDELQHGGRKPTETSVTEFCYKSVNLLLEELINIKVTLFRILEPFRQQNSSQKFTFLT